MAVSTEKSVTCDGCGTPKKEVNHWHRIRVGDGGFRVLKKSENRRKGDLDICGDRCAHSQFDLYLTQLREAQRAEAEAEAAILAAKAEEELFVKAAEEDAKTEEPVWNPECLKLAELAPLSNAVEELAKSKQLVEEVNESV